ncbi:MAG: GNAT family N-acetyltransferase [Clostridia bacterium]|nr:GNAT family N-acetyltransferase [Clostridia bacterium]
MKLNAKYFDELTTAELYEILKARAAVFVVEQNCVYQDVDGVDYRSLHVFYESDGTVNAYLRLFPKPDEEGTVHMGRVLTVQRGTGLGGVLLKDGIRLAREKMNARKIFLEAQCYAAGFYEREGFRICSGEFLEDGIPHVAMELTL